MRANLLVQEQINIILFGATYIKKEDFFDSEEFEHLVQGLISDEDLEDIVMGDADESSVNHSKHHISKENERNITGNNFQDNADNWRTKLKDFLLKSNEKWLLDQFNLCKRFLNQNSIEGRLKDFRHPLYEYLNVIKGMKSKLQKKNMIGTAEFEKLGIQSRENLVTEMKEENYRVQNIDVANNKLVKLDISALIKAIEEIESSIKMDKILGRKITKGKDGQEILMQEENRKDKSMRQQFSMLNFNRNYIALCYSQANPSDSRNKIEI
jgi:hypothetical protein